MAKTYGVRSGAWTRTKDDEVVYLSPSNAADIPNLLTKKRIAELVEGGVLQESGADDPADAESAAPAASVGRTHRSGKER